MKMSEKREADESPERSLWVDDTKPAPYGFEVATNYDDALTMLLAGGWDVLYLDFDLGAPGCNGPNLLKELVAREGTLPPVVKPISMSNAGREMIRLTVEDLRRATPAKASVDDTETSPTTTSHQ